MKLKRIVGGLLAAAMTISMSGNVFAAGINDVTVKKEAKNVILIIPDGMSVGGLTLARWYNGGEEFNVDSLASGLVRTYSRAYDWKEGKNWFYNYRTHR